jgi:hypothetical protein
LSAQGKTRPAKIGSRIGLTLVCGAPLGEAEANGAARARQTSRFAACDFEFRKKPKDEGFLTRTLALAATVVQPVTRF